MTTDKTFVQPNGKKEYHERFRYNCILPYIKLAKTEQVSDKEHILLAFDGLNLDNKISNADWRKQLSISSIALILRRFTWKTRICVLGAFVEKPIISSYDVCGWALGEGKR